MNEEQKKNIAERLQETEFAKWLNVWSSQTRVLDDRNIILNDIPEALCVVRSYKHRPDLIYILDVGKRLMPVFFLAWDDPIVELWTLPKILVATFGPRSMRTNFRCLRKIRRLSDAITILSVLDDTHFECIFRRET